MAPPCGREDAFPLRISSKWDSAEEGPAHHVLCTLRASGLAAGVLRCPLFSLHQPGLSVQQGRHPGCVLWV